jgi:16S rRNA (cytosine967-C5)-methyltransferase
VRAIALGTVRWYLRLAPAIEMLLARPKGVAGEVRSLLLTSAHQIAYSRNAPEATVHAAVDATRLLGEGRASGLVNAVLRRFVRERQDLLSRVDATLAGRTAHPAWLVDRVAGAWPLEHSRILQANNEHPPMALRVDLSRRSLPAYLADLADAGLSGRGLDWAPAAVILEQPVAVSELPGFREGIVSVQDAGAQLAAPLLDCGPGMRVLDACAAPGGKTAHLLERTPDISELVAVDIDPQRVARIQDNLTRLSRSARLLVADVRQPDTFWDGRPFDRILVDAPCSSTGVIRRHPDIKLLRRPGDIAPLAKVQSEILESASRMLAPGGRLVYSTCSILPEENERVVERVLSGDPTLRRASMPQGRGCPAGSRSRGGQRRLLLCLSRKDNGRNLSLGHWFRLRGTICRCIHATNRSNMGGSVEVPARGPLRGGLRRPHRVEHSRGCGCTRWDSRGPLRVR